MTDKPSFERVLLPSRFGSAINVLTQAFPAALQADINQPEAILAVNAALNNLVDARKLHQIGYGRVASLECDDYLRSAACWLAEVTPVPVENIYTQLLGSLCVLEPAE